MARPPKHPLTGTISGCLQFWILAREEERRSGAEGTSAAVTRLLILVYSGGMIAEQPIHMVQRIIVGLKRSHGNGLGDCESQQQM